MIAQLELLMVLLALIAWPCMFRAKRGVWYINNTAALMCMIRGRSDSPDLERVGGMIHAANFALRFASLIRSLSQLLNSALETVQPNEEILTPRGTCQ